MSPSGAIGVLVLIGLLGWWIVKDKTFDGMAPFYFGNAIIILLCIGSLLYYFIVWLIR